MIWRGGYLHKADRSVSIEGTQSGLQTQKRPSAFRWRRRLPRMTVSTDAGCRLSETTTGPRRPPGTKLPRAPGPRTQPSSRAGRRSRYGLAGCPAASWRPRLNRRTRDCNSLATGAPPTFHQRPLVCAGAITSETIGQATSSTGTDQCGVMGEGFRTARDEPLTARLPWRTDDPHVRTFPVRHGIGRYRDAVEETGERELGRHAGGG